MGVELDHAEVRVVLEGDLDDGRRGGVVAPEERPALARARAPGGAPRPPPASASRGERSGTGTSPASAKASSARSPRARRVGLDEVRRAADLAGPLERALALVDAALERDAVEDDVRPGGIGAGGQEARAGGGERHGRWRRTRSGRRARAAPARPYSRSSSERSATAASAQPARSTRWSTATTFTSRIDLAAHAEGLRQHRADGLLGRAAVGDVVELHDHAGLRPVHGQSVADGGGDDLARRRAGHGGVGGRHQRARLDLRAGRRCRRPAGRCSRP